MIRARSLAWAAVLALAASARFVLDTALVNRAPGPVATAAVVVPSALALALLASTGRRSALSARDRALGAIVGVAGVWLVPFLVALVRRTDAPTGSEVLFLTTAVSALLLVAGELFLARRRSVVRLAAVALGVTASAGLLANWERPSSFSPFVKFPTQELVILAAGVLFVAAVRVLEGLVSRNGALGAVRVIALPAAVAAAAGAVVFAPGSLALLGEAELWLIAGPAALAAFALVLALAEVLAGGAEELVPAAYLLPPALVTALTLLEQATGVKGASPILWPAAFAAIAVSIAAACAVAVALDRSSPGVPPSRLELVARALSVGALAAATVSLVTTDVLVSVTGVLASGAAYHVEFPMLGYETAGGWLAFCSASIAASWAWRLRGPSRLTAAVLVATLAVAVAAWFPLHATTLHTWTRWIPAEVQQDFGSEYASRTEQPVTDAAEPLAMAGAMAAGAILWFGRRPVPGEDLEA